jgi:hypothetical protein
MVALPAIPGKAKAPQNNRVEMRVTTALPNRLISFDAIGIATTEPAGTASSTSPSKPTSIRRLY